MTQLRVALLGAGAIAHSSHLPSWREVAGATVTWIVDRDLRRAQDVAAEFGIDNATTDADEAYRDVDAVDICLPPSAHVAAATHALEHGLHVLLEKPLALNRFEGELIQRARDQARTTVMIAENWVFSSAAQRTREILGSGELGDIFLVRAEHLTGLYIPDRHPDLPRWVSDPTGVDSGYLLNAGIHTISLCRNTVGEIDAVSVMMRSDASLGAAFDVDLVAGIEFSRGAMGSLTFSGRSRHAVERRLGIEIFGTRGVVDFDVLTGRVTTTRDGVATTEEPTDPSMGFVEEIQHFVDAVRSGVEPITSVEDQLRTMSVVDAMYRAARTNERVETRAHSEEKE
ncbi:MAG: Gfo/Idh/MocA family oxidoreductase [Microcella sp.]|uniref:Gfo/Idh/MocA family protein n=1 Tax=Microcella sp. TaxID=1913979 RepID=UPI0033144F57